MKISYNWLKDYIDFDKTPEQLAKDLSLFGHEADVVRPDLSRVSSRERERGVSSDIVLDLEITPNRGDCLSILGIAREISAMYNLKIRDNTTILRSMKVSSKITKSINLKVEDPAICSRFTARIIDGIKIGESPKWMQERLASYGFRPINNIVDITNYVMVATGQPLHAFDYDKIKNGLMNIRLSKKDEEMMTLDDKNRMLPEGAIIIEDEEKIYDLAGIMGGTKSEVDEKTKTIILQGVVFDPILIRRASKYLKLVTDASYRYERGVDDKGTISAVNMATYLIKECCPEVKIGELENKEIEKEEDIKIHLDINKINRLLGINISLDDAKQYLTRLGFITDGVTVVVPSYRTYDVKIWQDLAEEIARVYGYDKIPKSQISNDQKSSENQEFQKREVIKDQLKNLGFTEIYSYSFADQDKIELPGGRISDCVEIANPLSPDTKFLRPSILPSLLTAISKNPWAPEVNIFEIEKVFTKDEERWELGIATVGKSDTKLKEVIAKLNLEVEIKTIEQKILDTYKIRRPVKYLISDLEDIEDLGDRNYSEEISKNRYKKISKFPPTVRDLAFIVGNDVNADSVAKDIKSVDDKILIVELFDEYFMDNNKKNIAYHIWIQDLLQTMNDDDINKLIKDIISVLAKKFQAKLRSKDDG